MRVAIIGAHPDSKLDAPYHDTGWTVWACSMSNLRAASGGGLEPDIPRWDAWFELHRPMGLHVVSGTVPEDYVTWLKGQPLVYVRDPDADFPGAVQYPETALKELYGPYFFTSTIACMFAKAVVEGASEIGLWGVGMHSHEEYAYQKPGLHYFTQIAHESGIKVTVPPGSTLLDPPKDEW